MSTITPTRPSLPRAQLPRAPAPPKVAREPRLRRRSKLIALCVLVFVGLYLAHSRLVTTLIYEQRQQHLAAQLNRPLMTVGNGDALGLLQVESLLLNEALIEGVDVNHLRGGPAHLEGSALPGDAGVMVVYGHRTVYGGPFEKIVDLKNGDSVVVQARNGGPIVRYIVDHVERHVDLATVELEKTDQIAYLLLVTSEPGWLDDDHVVVVARSLPVTESAPVVPDLAEGVSRGAPFGIDILLTAIAGCGAALTFEYLRRRQGSTLVAVTAAAPMVVFAVIRGFMVLDSALALTR